MNNKVVTEEATRQKIKILSYIPKLWHFQNHTVLAGEYAGWPETGIIVLIRARFLVYMYKMISR